MKILITICARGGSKGIPGKNIRPLNHRPLIDFSIDVANQFSKKYSADVSLSTDDEEVQRVALQSGLSTMYKRPEYLGSDTAGKIDTISDLLFYEERTRTQQYDFILDLDVTSPLRTLEDLEIAFDTIVKDDQALNLFSVNPANRNPYFNMVEQQPNGYYGLIKTGTFMTRQSAPSVYDLNASFYFYRRHFFQLGLKKAITDKSLIYVMPHICFDLDHLVDFEFMEYLLVNDKLGFKL